MEEIVTVPVEAVIKPEPIAPPVSYIPTPSAPYRKHRKTAQLLDQPGRPQHSARQAVQTPQPQIVGARMLIWKQDPSVDEIGMRKVFIPGVIVTGPRDARITSGSPGIAPVSPNVFGDFVTAPDTPQFDAVHTFAVVRQTLTMYQRALAAGGVAAPLPWQWNSAANTTPLHVFPHGLPNVMNAFYSRTAKAVKFGDFIPSGSTTRVYTSRSFDIVSHETGHAVLDGLKPQWLLADNPPQTGGLHESFGDLTAIFLALSQLDQCEAIIVQTRANLHDKTFLSDVAEQFGLVLGRTNGLRNADNDLKLSEAGNEVHAISQVFTGAIYDILADMFAFERNPSVLDDAATLHSVGDYLRSLVLRSLIGAPEQAATFADVANQMLDIAAADGKPIEYRNFIRNHFAIREVVISPVPLSENVQDGVRLEADVEDAPDAMQDRRACCGTMNQAEYFNVERLLDAERQALADWCGNNGCAGDIRSDRMPGNGYGNVRPAGERGSNGAPPPGHS